MSEARRIGELLPNIIERAQRIAILAQFVDSLHTDFDRKQCITRLYEGGLVKAETAQLLIEHFRLEAA